MRDSAKLIAFVTTLPAPLVPARRLNEEYKQTQSAGSGIAMTASIVSKDLLEGVACNAVRSHDS